MRAKILEKDLKDYESFLLYVQSICLLQRPMETIGISVSIHFILWYGAQLNFVTLLVLGFAAYVVGAWFVDVVSVVIQWEKWVWKNFDIYNISYFYLLVFYLNSSPANGESQNDKKGGKNLSYPELIYEITVLEENLKQLWVSLQKARQKDPHRFTLYVTGILLIVAYLGSLVSGFVLVYVTVYILLLLPYMVIHQFHKRIYSFFEPTLPEIYEFLSSGDKENNEDNTDDSDEQTPPIDTNNDIQIDSDLSISSGESDLEFDEKTLTDDHFLISSDSDDLTSSI